MKLLVLSIPLFITALCGCDPAVESTNESTGKTTSKKSQPVDPAAMRAKWQEYMTPGEGHKHLEQLIGDWTYTQKIYMAPGQPPMEMSGTSKREWLLGGRYIQETVTGGSPDMPFEGRGLLGFNNMLKKYQYMWMDNMGTGMWKSEGSYDSEKQVFNWVGEGEDPMTSTTYETRMTTEIKSRDEETIRMYRTNEDGEESLTMELFVKRKK